MTDINKDINNISDSDDDLDNNSEISDNTDNINMDEQNILSQLDSKLIIKFHKEGRHSKTIIMGLGNYLNDEKQQDFVKTFKKKLGSSATKNVVNNQCTYAFSGDHVNTLYDYFVKIIPKDKIKRQ